MTSNGAMHDVQKELQMLGDPSGRQDGQYWDEWFDIVCTKQNHRSFEWYCSPDEVLRVVQHHLQHQVTINGKGDRSISTNDNEYAMIHPGSGTSILPITLRQTFPQSRQVIVDISKVAITEMKSIHDNEQEKCTDLQPVGKLSLRPIEYIVTDLLVDTTNTAETNLTTFLASTFDCWIDKGFVDAIFSDKHETRNQDQSKQLFQEANRILKNTTGYMITITLAEEHSLQIILDNWLSSNIWQSTLHIWELQPTSGNMPPFAFVIKKQEGYTEHGGGMLTMNFHPNETTALDVVTTFSDRTAIMGLIQEVVSNSRQRFALLQAERKNVETTVPKLLATIEVKTYDAEADLVSIGKTIQDIQWTVNGDGRSINVQWQSFTNIKEGEEMCNVVPIGYGISKLQLRCLIENDDLEELAASIEEWDADVVQSVDIDWSNTVPICNLDDVLRNQHLY